MQNFYMYRPNGQTGEEAPVAFDTRTTLFHFERSKTIHSDVGEGWFSSPDPFPWELCHSLLTWPGLTRTAGHAIGEELVDEGFDLEYTMRSLKLRMHPPLAPMGCFIVVMPH